MTIKQNFICPSKELIWHYLESKQSKYKRTNKTPLKIWSNVIKLDNEDRYITNNLKLKSHLPPFAQVFCPTPSAPDPIFLEVKNVQALFLHLLYHLHIIKKNLIHKFFWR